MILQSIVKDHIEWTSTVFPKATAYGALLHAEREIKEIQNDIERDAPKEELIEEYCDVFGCLFDSVNRSGITMEELNAAYSRKLEKNKARKWRDNGDGSYSHIKE